MDKKRLNNEIILCRPAVRKARVAVIRKILKNMKILKACKNESVKEKKLKKSERLFQKVQIMKRIKDDDVTKFALRNQDLEKFLTESTINLKQNALSCLARHEAVAKRITTIREQIPDWESNLPLLLDSLGKKRLGRTSDKKQSNEKNVKVSKTMSKEVPKVNKKVNNSTKIDEVKCKKEKLTCLKVSNKKEEDGAEVSEDEGMSESQMRLEKIDDPFFIQKKIIAPRLLPKQPNDKLQTQGQGKRDSRSFVPAKLFKAKTDSNKFSLKVQCSPVQKEEKLHPSWAAKKVQLIKPFQGKKIKFSDE